MNWIIGDKFHWNLNLKSIVFIQENALENAVCQNGGQFVQGKWVNFVETEMKLIMLRGIDVGISHVDIIGWIIMEQNFMASYPHGFLPPWPVTNRIYIYMCIILHYHSIITCTAQSQRHNILWFRWAYHSYTICHSKVSVSSACDVHELPYNISHEIHIYIIICLWYHSPWTTLATITLLLVSTVLCVFRLSDCWMVPIGMRHHGH